MVNNRKNLKRLKLELRRFFEKNGTNYLNDIEFIREVFSDIFSNGFSSYMNYGLCYRHINGRRNFFQYFDSPEFYENPILVKVIANDNIEIFIENCSKQLYICSIEDDYYNRIFAFSMNKINIFDILDKIKRCYSFRELL